MGSGEVAEKGGTASTAAIFGVQMSFRFKERKNWGSCER
jgi:hypothetical protein